MPQLFETLLTIRSELWPRRCFLLRRRSDQYRFGLQQRKSARSHTTLLLEETFMKFAKLFVVTAMTAVGATAHAQTLINCGGASEAAIGAATTTCRLTNQVSATVPTVARLEITSTTTTLTAPLAADFGTAA